MSSIISIEQCSFSGSLILSWEKKEFFGENKEQFYPAVCRAFKTNIPLDSTEASGSADMVNLNFATYVSCERKDPTYATKEILKTRIIVYFANCNSPKTISVSESPPEVTEMIAKAQKEDNILTLKNDLLVLVFKANKVFGFNITAI